MQNTPKLYDNHEYTTEVRYLLVAIFDPILYTQALVTPLFMSIK